MPAHPLESASPSGRGAAVTSAAPPSAAPPSAAPPSAAPPSPAPSVAPPSTMAAPCARCSADADVEIGGLWICLSCYHVAGSTCSGLGSPQRPADPTC